MNRVEFAYQRHQRERAERDHADMRLATDLAVAMYGCIACSSWEADKIAKAAARSVATMRKELATGVSL